MKNGKLFGLQLFAEAVAGKKIVYLYRILSTEKREIKLSAIYDNFEIDIFV